MEYKLKTRKINNKQKKYLFRPKRRPKRGPKRKQYVISPRQHVFDKSMGVAIGVANHVQKRGEQNNE